MGVSVRRGVNSANEAWQRGGNVFNPPTPVPGWNTASRLPHSGLLWKWDFMPAKCPPCGLRSVHLTFRAVPAPQQADAAFSAGV